MEEGCWSFGREVSLAGGFLRAGGCMEGASFLWAGGRAGGCQEAGGGLPGSALPGAVLRAGCEIALLLTTNLGWR